jgi:hypothetical protein
MKHLVSIVLAILSLNGFSQNWAPFPLDETSEWRERLGYLGGELSGTCFNHLYRIYNVADTVQQNGNEYFELGFSQRHWATWVNQPCSTLYEWPGVLSSGSLGQFRSENGRMLMLEDTNEVVFFDFTSPAGDTVYDSFHGVYVVDSVDQVIIGDNSCRRLWTHSWEQQPIWIIENIGHERGLFGSIHFFENDGSLCYLENQAPLASGGFYSSCAAVDVDSPEAQSVKLSPNPSTGIFNLDFHQQFSYQVFDLFGKLVDEGNGSGQSVIDITSQPNGIYLLRVESEEGSFTQKLVKQ